ncbi:MAG: DUF4105 domain-containing protein [Gemmatimonadales bacterium]
MNRARGLALAALLLLPVAPVVAQDAAPPVDRFQVLLMTMGPGEAVWTRFGHNAIVIIDTIAGENRVYNYGTFDFAAPGFVQRFVQGRPRYWLGVSDWQRTLADYTYQQRRVEVQELALLPVQEAELAFRLAQNAEPANREYLYDYFRDNCSTRVRDMLDQILGGALRRATEGVPAEGSLRFHMARSLTNDLWMYLGILTAMGPAADRPLDQWGEMFLPAKVQERVRELRVPGPDGRDVPLVVREQTVVDLDTWQVEAAPPDRRFALLGAGMVLAILIATGAIAGAAGIPGRVIGGLWAVVAGLGGVLLCYLWFLSDHVATAGNWNLLMLSPLALGLAWPVWRARGGAATRAVGVTILALALLGLVLAHLPGLTGQHNLGIALLLSPPSMVLGWLGIRVSRRPAGVPPAPR